MENQKRKTKHFQIEVHFSHSDPTMPVRRVSSVHTVNYESWPSVSAMIAGTTWAIGQRDRIFRTDSDPKIELVVIYPLFVMPLPKGSFDYQPSRDREIFRWCAATSGQSVEELMHDLTQSERRKASVMFLPVAS